jgi:C4-type Zn-finger protein
MFQGEKKKEHLKAKINDLETDSNNKSIGEIFRGVSDFKIGYQPITNIVKDEKGDKADSHSILARCRNQLKLKS